MFIYDMSLEDTESIGAICGHTLRSILKKATVDDASPSFLFQVQQPYNPNGRNYLDYSYACLFKKFNKRTLPLGTLQLSSFDDEGKHHEDIFKAILKQITEHIAQLQEHVLFDFLTEVRKLELNTLIYFVPEFRSLIGTDNIALVSTENIRARLADELCKLIQCICSQFGNVMIATVNFDTTLQSYRNFIARLIKDIPNRLFIVTAYTTNPVLIPNVSPYVTDKDSIAKETVKMLVREYFRKQRDLRRKLTQYILDDHQVTSASQTIALIHEFMEVSRIHSATNSSAVTSASLEENSINFVQIHKRYLLASTHTSKDAPSFKNFDESDEQIKVRCLCVVLGPYIRLQDLTEIYKICYNQPYPERVEYSTLALVIDERGDIRHRNIAIYNEARATLRQHSLFKRLYLQLHRNLNECAAIRNHIKNLQQRSDESEKLLELSTYQAITSLYALDTEAKIESSKGLSNSMERRIQKQNDDDDSEEKSEDIERIAELTMPDIGLIIQCFNKMINYHSAKMRMDLAMRCLSIISEFLNFYHTSDYVFDLNDITVAKMICAVDANEHSNPPFGKLDKVLMQDLTDLLTTMCMTCYFTEQGMLLRKYTIYGLQLMQHGAPYSPIIEASLALILAHTAESLLSDHLADESSVVSDSDNSQASKLEVYIKLRAAVQTLVVKVKAKLTAEPHFPGQALAWSMIGAVAGTFCLPYQTTAQYLMQAYKNGMQQHDTFKAIIAFGNAILLLFCAGSDFHELKNYCEDFIEKCDEYGFELPKPIIQGFLDFTDCYLGEKVSFSSKAESIGPNRFFISFTRMLGHFQNGNYPACIILAKQMHALDFEGICSNLRIGYNIQKDYLLLSALAVLRCAHPIANSERRAQLQRIRLTLRTLEQYASDYPENFKYRYEYLVAEIMSSKLALEISQFETVPLIRQINLYQIAYESAMQANNTFYAQSILGALMKVTANYQKQTQNKLYELQPHLKRTPELFPKNESLASKKLSAEDLIYDLISQTQSQIVMLFHVTKQGKISSPNVIYCAYDTLRLHTGAERKPLIWDRETITDVVKDKRLIHHECSKKPGILLFERTNRTVRDVVAVPVIEEEVVRAILYFHGAIELNMSLAYQNHLLIYASNLCKISLRNEIPLKFTIVDDIYLSQRRQNGKDPSSSSSSTDQFSASVSSSSHSLSQLLERAAPSRFYMNRHSSASHSHGSDSSASLQTARNSGSSSSSTPTIWGTDISKKM